MRDYLPTQVGRTGICDFLSVTLFYIFSHKFFPLQVIFLLARHLLCMYLFPLSDKVIRWEDDLGGGQISRLLSDIYITISIELAMRKNAAAGVTGRD